VFAAAFFVAVIPPLIGHESPSAWLYRALVLLVIACPCALVISTPITLVSAMTNAARKGILIKGGKYIEALGHVGAIAFDKTGTLTEGIPSVTDVVSLNSLAEDEILAIVAAIESHSEHHLAGAVISAARQRDITFRRNAVDHFESVPGKGIRATLGGVPYAVGNHQFCHEEEYCSPEVEHVLNRLQQKGKTTMVLGSMKKPLGIIGIMDTARRQADGAILNLRNLGIRHLSMLSGDHDQTARATALPLGLDAYEGGLLPGQKVERVQQLKEKFGTVAMVGDGVNDAPAFAASSVGIAMGVRGSDTALETADVVLMSDNLSGLSHTVALCRRTLAVVRQNIAIALGLKLLFLILSIGGVATLWMAVLADDGAALIVILNGLRMLSYTSEQ